MAVLPWQTPVPIQLPGSSDPVEAVSFPYLGSVLADDCSLDAEVSARISKAFCSLSRLLWKKIRSFTNIRIFKAVVIPTITLMQRGMCGALGASCVRSPELCYAVPENHPPCVPLEQAAQHHLT
jgi:hypothetical protein